MAEADGRFDDAEFDMIIQIMTDLFKLNSKDIHAIIKQSKHEVKESISISEFSSLIRDTFSDDEKFELMLNLWRLIYVDKKLDMYEDNLIKRIAASIGISHRELIGTKMLIREEMKID
ncbi:MAG: TerB family tellurite resistance protein [Ignavibacteriales bacterium]|nr:TerB family tellurite resistance protein [Ignavibacteriales bacterium]